MQKFLERFHDLVTLRKDLDLRAVAESLGKGYGTLMRQLNPWDRTARLGFSDGLAVARASRDPRVAALILEEAGWRAPVLEPLGHGPGAKGVRPESGQAAGVVPASGPELIAAARAAMGRARISRIPPLMR